MDKPIINDKEKEVLDVCYKERTYPQFIKCDGCDVQVYCSEKCKREAWENYHNILCTQNNFESPLVSIMQLCLYFVFIVLIFSMNGRTNPLFIIRMMTMMVLKYKEIDQAHPEMPHMHKVLKAKGPFTMFMTVEEESPLEEEAVDSLKQIIGSNAYDDSMLIFWAYL